MYRPYDPSPLDPRVRMKTTSRLGLTFANMPALEESVVTVITSFLRAVLSIALLIIGPVASAQELTKIIAGTVSPGAQQWPEYVAQEFGWFKENGIVFDLLNVGSGTAQQLAVGALNISHSGFPDFVRATNQGAPIKMFAIDIGIPPYSVYAKPSIKTIAALKGKTVSIGAVKDVTLIYLNAMLATVGLSGKDLDLVFAKAAGDRYTALAAGAVDAAILNPPSSFRAAAQGFTNLGDIQPYIGDFPFTVWAVNESWAAQNRKAVVAFIKTYTRAVQWLYEPANKAKAVEILVKYAPQDKGDAEQSFDYLLTKLQQFVVDGSLSDATFDKMAKGLAEMGDLTLPAPPKAKFFDSSYVDEAKAK